MDHEAHLGDHRTCDVLIVGAGPAGTAAAIEARRAGLDVVVVDKARFPRDKCCGDGLTTGALRNLDELGLDPGAVASWTPVGEVVIGSPRGRVRRYPLPDGPGSFAVVARRGELDAALVDLTREAGVVVLEAHGLSSVAPVDDGIDAVAGDVHFRCRHLIAADGMWSPTRKLLAASAGAQAAATTAADPYRGEWHAFRQYLNGVTGDAANELIVWFEPDLLPGYAWSFPLRGGVVNVGFGIQRGHRYSIQDMKALWPELLARPHIAAALGPDATPESPHRAWPIPARLGERSLSALDGRVIYVGDAAAATDPMTGEGIGQALETGRAAARALATTIASTKAGANGGAAPGAAADVYEAELRRSMVVDHSLARRLSSLLGNERLTEAALTTTGLNAWTRRNFARWLFEDYPRAVLGTPRRWRRGVFSAPGAFPRQPTS